MGRVLRGIDRVRDGYACAWCSAWCALAVLSLLVIAVFARRASTLLARSTPTGFLPEEDQGAFFVAVQLPDGASVARSAAVATRVEQMLQEHAAGRRRRWRSSGFPCWMAACRSRTPRSWWRG